MAHRLGLPVGPGIHEEFMQLLGLYPQPVLRQASVEYLPQPRRPERPGPPKRAR